MDETKVVSQNNKMTNGLFYDYINKVYAINAERRQNEGAAYKFYTETFGCQQNENDTERISGMLLAMGFESVPEKEKADLILFNTCAVREHAEQRVFGKVGALVPLKRANPNLKICLCGCMVQQKHIEERLSSYKHINLIFGTGAIGRLPMNIYRLFTEEQKIIDTDELMTTVPDDISPVRKDGLKAYVTVMNGCNNFCSYCVVPHVRGREHSRCFNSVKNEFCELVKAGYKDITLLGQNVNSYGKDTGESLDFADLLRELNAIEGDFRIRFMTSHPKDATEKLFKTIAECDKVCNHIHLPFQSGSDRVLKLMNRRYTSSDYIALTEKARKLIPDVTFTSDVIVGFPTETEEDFQATLSLIRKVGFNGLFTFIYSSRKNTPAAVMDGQIDKETKGDRMRRLLEVQNELVWQENSKFIGKTVKVLVEGVSENDGNTLYGRTDTNIIVNFSGDKESIGNYAQVEITKALNWSLFGNQVKVNK